MRCYLWLALCFPLAWLLYLRPWETLPQSAPSAPNAESRRELAATRERMLHLRLSRLEAGSLEVNAQPPRSLRGDHCDRETGYALLSWLRASEERHCAGGASNITCFALTQYDSLTQSLRFCVLENVALDFRRGVQEHHPLCDARGACADGREHDPRLVLKPEHVRCACTAETKAMPSSALLSAYGRGKGIFSNINRGHVTCDATKGWTCDARLNEPVVAITRVSRHPDHAMRPCDVASERMLGAA